MMRPTAPVAPTSATVSNTTNSLLVIWENRDEKSVKPTRRFAVRFAFAVQPTKRDILADVSTIANRPGAKNLIRIPGKNG
jgi:hypothetical protein